MIVFYDLCASLCFATLCFAMCCLRCVRFDVQGGDSDVNEDVQSLDAAAVVPDDAISVCIANQMCMSHTSAFEESMHIDDTCGVCSEVFEYQQVQTVSRNGDSVGRCDFCVHFKQVL